MFENYLIHSINQDILDYYRENIDENADMITILELDFKTCLKYYLEWNGIFGYDSRIITLIEYCLGDIEELEHDN